jgi:16S rRNA processing protein RimM
VADRSEWLVAGRVGRPHGLDGSFHVTRPRGALLVQGRSVRVGSTETEIVRRAGTDERPILRVDIAGTREDVLGLRGEDISVARTDAPPLEADEWYAEDLVGCAVVDTELGRDIGTVRDLLALPSCEALVIDRDGPELLVPLVKDCVRAVDIEAQRIDVDITFLGEEA